MLLLTTAVLCSILAAAAGHGRLISPPGRSTMWRYGFHTPRNSNDHQLSCGGFGVQFYKNDGKCGICGDPYDGHRDHEAGGKYALGKIADTYRQGDMIEVKVEITVNHGGWFEFRLCANNDYRRKASQECLDAHLLRLENGDTRYEMPGGLGVMAVKLQLPEGLTCSQCVLQWKWNTASNVRCDGSNCCRGCGPQEQFYGCSDVTISENAKPAVQVPQVQPRPPTNSNTHPVPNVVPGNIVPGSFIPISHGTSQGTGTETKPNSSNGSIIDAVGSASQCKATFSYKMFNPIADTWCVNSCANFGYCPATRCVEACRRRVVCEATPFWRSRMTNADEWCRQRCQTGLCPMEYCTRACIH